MYQVTWIEDDAVLSVSSPSYEAMRSVLVAQACMGATARLWDVSRKGAPKLIG